MSLEPVLVIAALSHANRLPVPMFEYRFHAKRKWRFDAAFVDARVAIEIEGGAFTRGRHTRGAGFVNDMEKYNSALLSGWKVLRYTPQQIASGSWVDDVKALMAI